MVGPLRPNLTTNVSRGVRVSGGPFMHLLDVLLTPVITVALVGVLVFLASEWVSTRLKESIKNEYGKDLEEFKTTLRKDLEEFRTTLQREELRKHQMAEIADVISLWIQRAYVDRDQKEHRYELQRKYWRLALYLEPETLKALTRSLRATTEDP